MNSFEEEKNHLMFAIQKIIEEIEKSKKELASLVNQGINLSFEDRKRGEHFNINAKADGVSKRIEMLNRSIFIPYFGRMDISFDNNEQHANKLYIGKSGVSSNQQTIVTDWRAPISSLYYDSEVGPVQYEAPKGQVEANMFLKKQINIKNSELIDVQNSSLVATDELLKPYLSTSADNRMKIIIASIQKEQNAIIRKPSNNNLIIQGVAGSGKTSVALHRIAYLIYDLRDKISSDQFLVLGPNDYFLNYASSILPDLETSPVNQQTFLNYANEYLEEKILLNDENNKSDEIIRKIQAYKSSLAFKKDIDKYMDLYIKDFIIEDDFIVGKDLIFSKDEVKNFLFSSGEPYPNYKRLEQIMIYKLENNLQEIYDKINKKYRDEYIKLPYEDKHRKELTDYSTRMYDSLKKDGSKLIKKYVKSIKKSSMYIYMMLVSSFDNLNITLSEKEKLIFQKETLTGLSKKKIGFEDIPALIHIYYRLTNKKFKYKYLVVDEAQDYGMFHFDVLKETNPNSNFAIYGDLAQAIYSYRSINSWDKVNNEIFENKCEICELNKSYRTTIEITKNANNILDHLGLNEAQPVVRHGKNIQYLDMSNGIELIASKIYEMQEKGYETIAVICKTDSEAKKLNSSLQKFKIITTYICDKNSEYDGKVFVLTSAAAKGLEFDTVIINNASSNIYDIKSDVDMHLLYVACTRALHELIVLYDKELVEVLKEEQNTLANNFSSKVFKKN